MPDYERTIDRVTLGITIWTAVLLFAYSAAGVKWFVPDNFHWREAMSFHGMTISAWMLLNLAFFRQAVNLSIFKKICVLLCMAAFAASLFSGIGGFFVWAPGMSTGTLIQIAGMFLGDLVGIVALILALLMLRGQPEETSPLVLISLVVCLAGMSFSTPLGHLAAAIHDFGNRFGILSTHGRAIDMKASETFDFYVGSHGHEMVSAFIYCALLIPFFKGKEKSGGLSVLATVGMFLATVSTLAQIGVYQFSAWARWDPPVLFKSGPNGMPLDDLILSVLGLSLLLLVPPLLRREPRTDSTFSPNSSRNRTLAFVYISYLITMAGLGVYIEFHERLFGGANLASGAPWVNHDLIFIRAHLIYGCMLVPLIMSLLVNLHDLKRVCIYAVAAVVCFGMLGELVWTFYLQPSILKLSYYSAAVTLLISAIFCVTGQAYKKPNSAISN